MGFCKGVEIGVRFSGLDRLIGGVLRGDMASICGITSASIQAQGYRLYVFITLLRASIY